MKKRLTTVAVLSGVLLASAGGSAFAQGGRAGASARGAGQVVARQGAAKRPAATQKARKAGRNYRGAVLRNVLRVTAVSGGAIDAVARGGQPVTITVGTTTTYQEVGIATASLSNVTPGESILVRGARTAPRTIQATVVRILLARVAGVVTAVSGSTLTVTGLNGTPRTVNIGATTVNIGATTAITRAGAAATAADITPNTSIVAAGTPGADGSLNATRIIIRAAHVAGKVTAIDGSTITLQDPYGATYTVTTSSGTIYAVRHGKTFAAATAADVTAGRRIVAYGAHGVDGKTLAAQRIVVGQVVIAKQAR